MKAFVVGALVIAIANEVFERFILKGTPDEPGFIQMTEGFGMDEIARGAFLAASLMVAKRAF